MSNSISKSLNMRSIKDAMEDQENYETSLIEDESEATDIVEEDSSIISFSENTPMDKAYKDLTELDQTVFEHTQSSNEVMKTAREAFDTIFTVAQSVPPEKSARLYEVAAQYLDIVNKSSDSKVTAKYDRAKLSVALTKAQIQAGLVENAVNQGIKAHRNDILKAIMGGEVHDAEFSDDSNKEEDK